MSLVPYLRPAALVAALAASTLAAAQTPRPESDSQHPVEGSQPVVTSGVNTGGAHSAQLDPQHRPITAGGFVKSGPIPFEDITSSSGLGSFRQRVGTPEKSVIVDTLGSGVALLDFDNDGWLDIYLVNGSTSAAEAGKEPAPRAALFHNNHDGTFTDVTARAGVANERWGVGATAVDFDNDGWTDLFVSNFGKNRLFHNNHNGTFTDVAEKAGVTVGAWSTGSTWADFDGDGRLDLFVPGYVHMNSEAERARTAAAPLAFCEFRGVKVMCGPRGLPGEGDHLFHNNGDGTFTDVSQHAGVSDPNHYFGLASLFVDVNNDGKPDLLVADDSTPNYLYLNKGDGTFEDASFASGYALNESGRETASMGIASGDLTHNGRVDVYNTTFSDDYNPLYRNDGDANFTDISYQSGIADVTIPFLGWGDAFFDYDNDGWLDLFVVNGHVYPQVDAQNWGTTWQQRPLLFHSDKGKLTLVPPVEGSALAKLATSRGLAVGDLFNDGHMDVVINNMDGAPSLFRNITKSGNHWLGLHLVGSPAAAGKSGSPREPIGATVWVTSNGFRQRADLTVGGSFASSSDPRLHFGLGPSITIDKLEVRWPSGRTETILSPNAVDTIYTLEEGKGTLTPDTPK